MHKQAADYCIKKFVCSKNIFRSNILFVKMFLIFLEHCTDPEVDIVNLQLPAIFSEYTTGDGNVEKFLLADGMVDGKRILVFGRYELIIYKKNCYECFAKSVMLMFFFKFTTLFFKNQRILVASHGKERLIVHGWYISDGTTLVRSSFCHFR